jgi:nucleoside-diphosphate-sugar epimerase
MPLTYVENTASLIAACGRHERAAGQVFNCVDPEPITQREYLRHWRRAQPRAVTVVPLPLTLTRASGAVLQLAERRSGGRLGPPAFLDPYVMEPTFRRFTYGPTRATALLGWHPPVPLSEALRRTFGAATPG